MYVFDTMYKYFLAFGVTLLLLLTSLTKTSFAQEDCTIIYGGGETNCKAATNAGKQTTATPTPAQDNKPQPTNAPTTKGGLPVYKPTQTTQTPETGPEAYALISLVPAAALGFYLRSKIR
jgi:hypothetical protein